MNDNRPDSDLDILILVDANRVTNEIEAMRDKKVDHPESYGMEEDGKMTEKGFGEELEVLTSRKYTQGGSSPMNFLRSIAFQIY